MNNGRYQVRKLSGGFLVSSGRRKKEIAGGRQVKSGQRLQAHAFNASETLRQLHLQRDTSFL